jgi:hypothetical protein
LIQIFAAPNKIAVVVIARVTLVTSMQFPRHFSVFIHRRLDANGKPVGPAKLNTLPSDSFEYDDDDDSSLHQVREAITRDEKRKMLLII